MKLRDIFTVLLVSLPLISSAADNPTPRDIPRAGATCQGSTASIMTSLPLGTGTPDADILRIESIFVDEHGPLAGWLYTTRSGKHFIENDALNTLKGKLGDSDIAIRAKRAFEVVLLNSSNQFVCADAASGMYLLYQIAGNEALAQRYLDTAKALGADSWVVGGESRTPSCFN